MSTTPVRVRSASGCHGVGGNASEEAEEEFNALKQKVSVEFAAQLQEWKDNDTFPDPYDDAIESKLKGVSLKDSMLYAQWLDRSQNVARNDLQVDDRRASTGTRTPVKDRRDGKRDDMVAEYLVEGENQPAEPDKLPPSNPVNVLDGQLKLIIESSKDTNTHDIAPFVCLLQSTGHGKTRCVLELAKKGPKKVVYLPCKNMEDETWMVPSVLDSVIESIESEARNLNYRTCEKKWCKFLDAVEECVRKYEDLEALHYAQITKEGSLGPFYGELAAIWDEKTIPVKNPLRSCLKSTNGGVSHTQPSDNDLTWDDDLEKSNIVNYPKPEFSEDNIVICLDKVSALSEMAYRTYRRAAKFKQILSVFSDTAASICKLNPPNDHSTSIGKGRLGVPLPPIFRFHTIDLYWKPFDTSDTSMSEYLELFCAGRPRWGSFVKSKLKKGVSDPECIGKLVELASQLLTKSPDLEPYEKEELSILCRGVQKEKISFSVEPNMVACFACRFAMGPRSKISSILAKHCLATINDVSSDREYLQATYMSEPVLAEASAMFTNSQDNMKKVLDNVLASFSSEATLLEAPRGDTGEMCVAALLGFMMDSIRKDKESSCMSAPVPLFLLLANFECWDAPAQNEIRHLVEDWEVNFTHFYRPYWTPTREDLPILWRRRCAYYVPAGHKGLDLLIPIRNKATAAYGTIRVQVKNYKNKISQSERKEILTKLWPQNCAPYIKDEPFSVGILITSGEIDEGVATYSLSNQHCQLSHCGENSWKRKKRTRGGASSNENDTDPMVLQLTSSMRSCHADKTYLDPLLTLCGSTSTSNLDDQDPFASCLQRNVFGQEQLFKDVDDHLEGVDESEDNMHNGETSSDDMQ